MTKTETLPKTQAATMMAIALIEASASAIAPVRIGHTYAGVQGYKGVNASAVHALVAKGLLVVDSATQEVSIA